MYHLYGASGIFTCCDDIGVASRVFARVILAREPWKLRVEFTVLELAIKTIQLTGSMEKIGFLPLRSDDSIQRLPDVPLAPKELNWVPA